MASALDDRRHYAAAGLGHLHDGWHLLHAGRKASADHLAGRRLNGGFGLVPPVEYETSHHDIHRARQPAGA